MQQLSPMDATFLYLESEDTHAHGTFVWLYDAGNCEPGSVNRRALMEHMRQRLHVSPVFTRKIHRLPLDFDYPYWVDDPGFELLYHVREQSAPGSGDWEGFCDLVAKVHSEPLNQDHPLWEMTLVPDVNGMPGLPPQCFAILGKFHHVAIDGATGMAIIANIHDSGLAATPVAAPATQQPADQPGLGGTLYRAAIRNLGALEKARKLWRDRQATSTSAEPEELEPLRDPEPASGIPQTLFNTAISPQRSWDSRSFDLDRIKAMRKLAPGCTVNDVLLAIVSGGLRRYLEGSNALPDKPMKAGCPVNIRTESEAQAGGNVISAMIVNMHTHISGPLKRLKAIKASSAAAKDAASRGGSRKILDMAAIVPAQTQALLGHMVGKVSGKLNRAMKFNCSVSNLPGPQQELGMLGGTLHTISAAMPVMPGFGLFVGLCTCAGRLSICMSSAANITPRIQDLGDCMEQSFAEYEKLLSRKTN